VTKIKVLVVYPYLQHYRLGVFREMDKTDGIEYTFASDVVGRHVIEPLPRDAVRNHILTTRKECGPISWQRGLLSVVAKHDYDVVIFFAEVSALSTWVGALLARFRKKPVLFWTTGWHRPDQGIKRLFRNAFYLLSHQLLLYGELGKSIGTKMNFPIDKMTVIGNSVETATVGKAVEENWTFQKNPDDLVLGAVIRLIPVKRLDLLIQAVALLKQDKTVPNITVLIIGEGPEREKLQNLSNELGVELELPGALYSKNALSQVYEVLDITVVPAAVGLTAIQSMQHGVPVVSNDAAYSQMPEWESIKPGITGELFEQDNVYALAEAIGRIASLRPEDRAKMSENCKEEISNNWTAKSHAKRIATAIGKFVSLPPTQLKGVE